MNSDAVLAHVEQIGGRLAAQLPQESPFPYKFEIIAQSDGPAPLEALSLPGGYIFVQSRLILGANDQSEFAGGLAHAIVHIAEHHGARTATSRDGAQLATIPFIFIRSYGSSPDVAMPVGMLPRQRANESAADLIAVKLLADAGCDPEGLVHYIARVQRDPTRASFSPYPPRDERIQAILKTISALP